MIGEELPPPPEGAITEEQSSLSSGRARPVSGETPPPAARTSRAWSGTRRACRPVTTRAASTRRPRSSQDGSDWVLRIPAGSPLLDRHVTIGTDADGGLNVFFAGDEPGSLCGVSPMQARPRPAS